MVARMAGIEQNLGIQDLEQFTPEVGPPLLLVHGWPQTWYAWRLVMPGDGSTSCTPSAPGSASETR
jgi:hypothetical protein